MGQIIQMWPNPRQVRQVREYEAMVREAETPSPIYTTPEELARIDRIMADIRKERWQRAVAWFCYATLVLIACIAAFQIGRGL